MEQNRLVNEGIFLFVQILYGYLFEIFSFNRLHDEMSDFLTQNNTFGYRFKCIITNLQIMLILCRLVFYLFHPEYVSHRPQFEGDFLAAFVKSLTSFQEDALFINVFISLLLVCLVVEFIFHSTNKKIFIWNTFEDVILTILDSYKASILSTDKSREILQRKYQSRKINSIFTNVWIYYQCKMEMFYKFESVDLQLF